MAPNATMLPHCRSACRSFHRTLLLFAASLLLVALMAGCGAPEDSDSSSSSTSDEDPSDSGTTYTYNITSSATSGTPGAFDPGFQVGIVRVSMDEACENAVDDPEQVGVGTVTTAGQVSIEFTDDRTGPFLETHYVDEDASDTVNSGDSVYGNDPSMVLFPFAPTSSGCWNTANYSTTQTFDWWDDVASSVGAVEYTGSPLAFAAGPGPGSLPAVQMQESGVLASGDDL